MTGSIASRAAVRLITLHAELRQLLRTIRERQQTDLFAAEPTHLSTIDAATALSTVRLSAHEAHDLARATMPPAAHDTATRIEHALLLIAVHNFLTNLQRVNTEEIPAAAIAAAQILHLELGAWLRLNNVVRMRVDDTARTTVHDRPRQPKARIKRRPRRSIMKLVRAARTQGPDSFTPAETDEPAGEAYAGDLKGAAD